MGCTAGFVEQLLSADDTLLFLQGTPGAALPECPAEKAPESTSEAMLLASGLTTLAFSPPVPLGGVRYDPVTHVRRSPRKKCRQSRAMP